MANSFRHGNVKIANEILAQLAIRACKEVNGVYNLEDSSVTTNHKDLEPKALVNQLDDKINIDLTINLSKNVNVRKIVKEIQENVKRVIESMTGLTVGRVNVNVGKLEI